MQRKASLIFSCGNSARAIIFWRNNENVAFFTADDISVVAYLRRALNTTCKKNNYIRTSSGRNWCIRMYESMYSKKYFTLCILNVQCYLAVVEVTSMQDLLAEGISDHISERNLEVTHDVCRSEVLQNYVPHDVDHGLVCALCFSCHHHPRNRDLL